ncbi:choice-of-anchor M domain-containing protein [Kineosporia sp. J2-2]|uniref:Choice-of-anchor M domain-containing protein n=1 Tax=Kineosporia corallincola TaxID=2835133 RepID=A0ABS5TTE9_9ACTN|nr:choice-of-anchor M domain-containing protein [Kineosporia corallincola]MBT0774035.1 choice-of-anchor M domain-containing protein [Kineosporia corallincola]
MRIATPLAAATLTAAAVLAGGPAQAAATVQISQGHVDAVDVAYEDGELGITIHDESVTPDVERDPADVVLVVKKEAKWTVPDDPAFAFLGAPGTKVWLLPEIQDENLLWPGLSAEEIESGVFVGDSIRLEATKFSGPDGLSLFTNGPSGEPQIIADSEDGLPDVYDLPAGFHVHENWAFEKAGTYKITVRASGQLASTNEVIRSAPAVITFKVKN